MGTTRTIKNKHAANGSGIKGSKASKNGPVNDGVIKAKKNAGTRAPIPGSGVKGRPNLADILKKRKKRVYSEKELGLPQLNMVTPVGVQKPRGKKKGKVFVDDRESMATILAIVQAEKDGQIESKMIKARQMEEIREARRAEADKKESERKAKLEETKDSLRKKRKRPRAGGKTQDDDVNGFEAVKALAAEGTKAAKPKKKRVSFAAD
ncbi:putative 60s ribosomal subunit assembly export protein loc1 protein [Echria macrotheca]|uniref:60s ribosomal subunit assembly export protein loc1 protein n=1 Tax=Echria macrotheca TaxID=438768 RepID=A0AAJ0BF79_9PEZI|nr:putative 60s ribosomal subunit assembly export protein loc1 protein [Echria macrotheca]